MKPLRAFIVILGDFPAVNTLLLVVDQPNLDLTLVCCQKQEHFRLAVYFLVPRSIDVSSFTEDHSLKTN